MFAQFNKTSMKMQHLKFYLTCHVALYYCKAQAANWPCKQPTSFVHDALIDELENFDTFILKQIFHYFLMQNNG